MGSTPLPTYIKEINNMTDFKNDPNQVNKNRQNPNQGSGAANKSSNVGNRQQQPQGNDESLLRSGNIGNRDRDNSQDRSRSQGE